MVRATGTKLGGDRARTTLTVDLTGPARPHIFTLADPYRVIIDLPDVVFGTAPLAHEEKGLVSAYRYGLIAPRRSRIVIDTKEPVKAGHSFSEAVGGQPAKLVIDLAVTSRSAFLQDMQEKAPAELPPAPKVVADETDKRPVVVIDPGHGGIDTGAKGAGGEEEKNVVLGFAHTLAAKLNEAGRYRVVMTREDDSFIALADRVKIARENGARLFLSIHADSLADPFGVRGATVYTLSETASDAEAARLAEKENRADIIAGVNLTEEPDEVADILIDLARRETKVFSVRLANNLVGSARKAMRLNKNPQRSAGFLVLKAPDVPSVLLELGYMTNKEDLNLMQSQDWRDKAAAALAQAIDGFFGHPSTAGGGGGSSVN
ncbi:N-acetylmuramoyl-L-alanine amidase [Terrihabitans soli]|uniref:N-acetylmuramoyl-L-alanine amidase n=1 Tax=Terrihabitans soli TaxID=708113 RepID=A0A6S6QNT0_9HYPH|nr:N-acetylmuramoyl-L-alanine amidase [Terrihabitans soli]